jgi:hypothetical protein
MCLLRDKPHPPRTIDLLPHQQCLICGKRLDDPLHDMSLRTDGIVSEAIYRLRQLVIYSSPDKMPSDNFRDKWGW